MTEVLSVLATAALFVLFGWTAKHLGGCGGCGDEANTKAGSRCGTCPKDERENFHV